MAELIGEKELRASLMEGCRLLRQAAAPLYGPSGKTVWFEPPYDIPMAAGSIQEILPDVAAADPGQMAGIRLLAEAAGRVGRSAGAGVGTTILLAEALLEAGGRMAAADVNPTLLRKGAYRAVDAAVGHMRRQAFGAGDGTVVRDVLRTAATDEAGVHALLEAFRRVGHDGIITIEDSQLMETEIEAGGIRYEYGCASAGFADDPIRKNITLHQPYLLLVDEKLESIVELEKLLLEVIEKNAELLIIAKDYSKEFLEDILRNVRRGVFRVAAALAPNHGESRRRNMEALALRSGGILQRKEMGCVLERCGLEICGRAESAEAGKEYTKLFGTECRDLQALAAMQKRLLAEFSQAESPEQRESYQQTLAILAGDSAVIRAGGATEIEMFARKRSMENALSAARSAWRSGAVAGGGVCYLEAIAAVEELLPHMEPELMPGARCVTEALRRPAMCIADNVGENGPYIAAQIADEKRPGYGFDAAGRCFCDMRQAGILDPA